MGSLVLSICVYHGVTCVYFSAVVTRKDLTEFSRNMAIKNDDKSLEKGIFVIRYFLNAVVFYR